MIILKVNMTIDQNYYLQTLIVKCIKLKLKTSARVLAALKKCLISVIIQLSQNNMIIQID